MINIWLDDLRNPLIFGKNFVAPTRALNVLLQYGRDGWIWVKTVEEAQALLTIGDVAVLSCDNDLGAEKEGFHLLNWLEEKAFTEPNFPIPQNIYVHSDNVDRIGPMQQAIDNIKRYRDK